MACSKLEAMAIYLVKQARGNDKLACVYFWLALDKSKVKISQNFVALSEYMNFS